MNSLQPQSPEQIPNQQQHPLANYQFSSDELRVLRECNTESFFQRSIPLGTTFGLGAYLGVKQGYLRPNIKYGAVPKVVVGVVVGYFLGKFSYQQKCAEKIMRLPNSRLGEILRQKQKGGGMYSVLAPDQNIGTGMAISAFTPSNADVYSDDYSRFNGSSSLELDTESRPTISGLDDTYRPTLDDPAPQYENELPIITPKQGVTYDELRMKNREEYAKKSQSPVYSPLPSEAPVVKRKPPSNDSFDGQDQVQGQKNKYGDTWTN